MSESPDRERVSLQEIERALHAQNPRLARQLARPSRWTRLRWGRRPEWLIPLTTIAALSLLSVVISFVLG